mgnify:CR=1 FL=1
MQSVTASVVWNIGWYNKYVVLTFTVHYTILLGEYFVKQWKFVFNLKIGLEILKNNVNNYFSLIIFKLVFRMLKSIKWK